VQNQSRHPEDCSKDIVACRNPRHSPGVGHSECVEQRRDSRRGKAHESLVRMRRYGDQHGEPKHVLEVHQLWPVAPRDGIDPMG
jgi:hypothetical protein